MPSIEHENHEHTPLLNSHHPTSTTRKKQDPPLSSLKLIALTCINGGLQVFFSTVMANLAPYLQQLGLSKSATAAIIISLPLSGALIGPAAGSFSDSHIRTRYGRRRPMILLGTSLTMTWLVLLAWTPEITTLISSAASSGDYNDRISTEAVTLALAVMFTLFLSVSVQPVQAGVRALMVDIARAQEQSRASAFASRIQGGAAIFSFFASSLTLNRLPGLRGFGQFQVLALLNLCTLGGTVGLTCGFVRERDSRRVVKRRERLLGDEGGEGEEEEKEEEAGVLNFFKKLWRTVRELPETVAQACKVQFASWMAWFPFLYYNTTYIGELVNVAELDDGSQLAQAGSIASLCFAAVGFFFMLALPAVMPSISRLVRRDRNAETGPRDLIWLWLGTQPVLGLLLALTLAAAYQWQGTVLVALAGLPWAVTQWVPWAVVGYETSRLSMTGAQEDDESTVSQSGAILGVHNMAISLPQVLSGAISSVTYRIAESAESQVPTAWVLATSGIAAFVASFLARKMLM